MSAVLEKPLATTGTTPKELEREPLVLNQRSLGWISDRIAGVCENALPKWWWPAFLISFTVMSMMFICIAYLISTGVGVWGLNNPVGWAWDITNFVFWIGIGHAGTLISAVLFLLRQKWRTRPRR
jgi:molybdopterin-containing oxidoreductase family membrane subunit